MKQSASDLDLAWPKIRSALREIDPRMSELDFQYMRALAIKLMQRTSDKINAQKQTLALDFLQDAKTDFKASKSLYSDANFGPSVFYLQQSAEKACKSFGLVTGTLELNDARKKIKHRSPLVFINMLREPIIDEMVPIFRKFGLKEERKNIASLEKLVSSNSSELTLLEDEQLKKLLSIVDKVREEVVPLCLPELNRIRKTFVKYLPEYENEIMNFKWGDYIILTTTLYIVGVISFSHEQSSRYSDTQPIKAKNYTRDIPIVKALPKMQNGMENALESLEQYVRSIGR